MGDAQLKIENSLVPKGPNVVRHLSLPAEGRTPEWIAEEMNKMDNESEKRANWKGGKLSGAVYRECLSVTSGFREIVRPEKRGSVIWGDRCMRFIGTPVFCRSLDA